MKVHFKASKFILKRAFFVCLFAVLILLTVAASVRYSIPVTGLQNTQAATLNQGWSYEANGDLVELDSLPCHVTLDEESLILVRDIKRTAPYPEYVLAIQTRYQSIRVWADEALIYEAAQGEAHALGSIWHFVPTQTWMDASILRIELTRYDQGQDWELTTIYQDHPAAILVTLFCEYLPTVLVFLFCMLFSALLLLALLAMRIRNIQGHSIPLALAGFIFLSGLWILLDSKITTVTGGNFAFTYFLSYMVFYLLPLPLLYYFHLMLKPKHNLFLMLIWITAGNAALWMLLHLLGVVSIRNTTISVHLIILSFLIVFVREIFMQKRRQNKPLLFTFWGVLFIFAIAIISIALYYFGLLPPTNSAVLYAWGLLGLIVCLVMDMLGMFSRIWKEKQTVDLYKTLATVDGMSGLGNRNAYELKLQELIAYPPAELCLILFDIDKMKRINDFYGHHAGDQVIILTASCIREIFGSCGHCYRIGGDEFCVVLTDPCDVRNKLKQFDRLLYSRNQHPFPVEVSHGWKKRSFPPETSITLQDLIRLKKSADALLYRHKYSQVSY